MFPTGSSCKCWGTGDGARTLHPFCAGPAVGLRAPARQGRAGQRGSLSRDALAVRIIFTLLAVIIVLGWAGFELRPTQRDWSTFCWGVAGLLALLLAGAFFGVYGG